MDNLKLSVDECQVLHAEEEHLGMRCVVMVSHPLQGIVCHGE